MSNVYSLMQTEKPYKAYIKRSLGKLHVNILNPFSGEQEGLILVGDPRKEEPSTIVEVWSDKEDLFFKRSNRKHFEAGEIVEYAYKEPEMSEELRLNTLSDEELAKILADRFYTLSNYVKKVTVVAPLYTLLRMAEEQEKSEKIINTIKSRIEELQRQEFGTEETTD